MIEWVSEMKWIKKGLLFKPEEDLDWIIGYAAIPFAQHIGDNKYRVYCSGRDSQGCAQIGFFEFNIDNPAQIFTISEKPVVSLGPLGSFDDRGLTNSWLVEHKERQYLYYSGWTIGVTVPFYFYVGLAISDDNGVTFKKASLSPILERNEIDPFLTATPCILIEDNIWRMWYVSGVKWELENGKAKHYYNIKYAESQDGIKWDRRGKVCIDFKSDEEYAIARPSVLVKDGRYQMWYCYRGNQYKIGYAESLDGLTWERKDEDAGIEKSPDGWDSEMLAYPFVFEHQEKLYMLYNGNGYGKSGIGLAVLA